MIRWGGTTFSLHPLFVLILGVSAITGHILELLVLFSIVFIHEMGHVVAARLLGWSIEEVKLLPFGGVAESNDGALAPAWQECVVAAAGPLQNAILIVIALGCEQMGWWSTEWTAHFIEANAFIALFNLLPILPLDGGRIVQALCSLWMSYHRTLVYGAWISIIMSVVMGLFALSSLVHGGGIHLNILVLALFLLWTNWTEWRNTPYRFVRFLMHRPLRLRRWERQVSVGRPIIAQMGRPLSDIVRLLQKDAYHIVYVMNSNGRIQRIVPEQQLIDAYFADPPLLHTDAVQGKNVPKSIT
ncbi:M50 family metallopeptidase [Paenibacillus sp. 481]|uniref:M50 family metallopeptidase n=1 Tax=Paenibacillus sp. 481 TaxID=2835869 RepID=UPI001E58B1FC|nr:M50 family metallopeptidase [Paenibacillus sp. 481]UHA74352.1 M50 family metallopeptidase [Paenibacillus sp. 481]